jgi:hypothetical protein
LPALRDPKKRTPPNGGVLSNSALVRVLAGLLTGLLRLLLPRLLTGLLALLLIRLIRLAALLRLTLVVLFHVKSPKNR